MVQAALDRATAWLDAEQTRADALRTQTAQLGDSVRQLIAEVDRHTVRQTPALIAADTERPLVSRSLADVPCGRGTVLTVQLDSTCWTGTLQAVHSDGTADVQIAGNLLSVDAEQCTVEVRG
tara:strand:+ start:328 stop:693 length:366 start_codon:yes stop_codon:yes gene_type:complete